MNKHLKITVFILIVLILSINYTYSQIEQYEFEHITTKDGLPSDKVTAILKDSDGFMWFGTGDGLVRYDGNKCKTFFPNLGDSSSYPNNYISSLIEDENGNLWIGTSKTGLYKFNRQTETFCNYQHDPLDSASISHNHVYIIYQDDNNMIWIGTNGGGLNKFNPDTGKFISYRPNSKIPDYNGNIIRSLYEDRTGIFWVGTRDGIFQFDRLNNQFIPFDLGHKIPLVRRDIICIMEDNISGNLWFGTKWGLFKFDPAINKTTHFFYDPQIKWEKQLSNISIYSIVETSENNDQIFWIATGFGIEIYNVSKEVFAKVYNDPDNSKSLSNSTVLSLYLDASGILWMGTFCGGVNSVNLEKHKFQYYNPIDNTDNNFRTSASCFCVDKENNVWFGTSATGIWKLDANFNEILRQLVYTLNPKGPDVAYPNTIDCIYEDKKGTMWIVGGRRNSIYSINEFEKNLEKHEIETPDGVPEPDRIYEILEDNYNVLWIATNSGIYKKEIGNRKKGPFQLISHDQLSNLHITELYVDSYDYLWIGTYNSGLFYLPPSNRMTNIFLHFENDLNNPSSITNNHITDIYEDLYGDLWISTAGGLNKWNRELETFENFNHIIDPMSMRIKGVLGDNSGYIWLNTSKGLLRFDPKTSTNPAVKLYNTKDGVPFDLISENAFYKTKDGRFFLGGLSLSNDGFYCFNPDSIKDNTKTPPVFLTNLLIHNENAQLDSSITYKKDIFLKYNKNFFSFEFTVLDYTNPKNNQYAYYLEGFDNDWIYSKDRRYANYTGVTPGDYIFRVKGSNNDGYWNEEGASILITILPPPWKTWWAYSLYGILLICLFYFGQRYYHKRQRLRKELILEHAETEKLKDLDEMKSRFFANISHEFRTPLTLILGPLGKILLNRIDETARPDLNMIQRNAGRLQKLINQLLSLSKLESGRMKLQSSKENIVSLVNGYVQSFESLTKQRKITLEIIANTKDIQVYVDREKLEKILFNLISNAFKFTDPGGYIKVKIDRIQKIAHNDKVGQLKDWGIISISDTGKGIRNDQLEHIFDRFYQGDESNTKDKEGTGIGLALVKELVELHHGEIQVESKDHVGTTFIISFPLGRKHLKENEIVSGLKRSEAEFDSDGLKVDNDDFGFEIPESQTQKFTRDQETDPRPVLLIVEDNDDLRSYIRGYLDESYIVIEANDGENGLNMAIVRIPDLIISDVMMPRMDGIELCRNIKTDERTNHIPVILLTARASREDRIEGLETGADDFLTKPFDPEELLVRIENLIKQRHLLTERLMQNAEKVGLMKLMQLPEAGITSMDHKFLQKAIEVIENNITDSEFDVEKFQSEMTMSRMQLHRKLIATTGQTPNRFIRYLRLNKAAALLAAKSGNVTEIAFEVGFNNLSYFAKCFHQQFGVTPSDYTKKH